MTEAQPAAAQVRVAATRLGTGTASVSGPEKPARVYLDQDPGRTVKVEDSLGGVAVAAKSKGKIRVSCLPCLRSKVRCSNERPCHKCVSRGIPDQCQDRPLKTITRRKNLKYVKNPCSHCKTAKVPCTVNRPCNRCVSKGLSCESSSPKTSKISGGKIESGLSLGNIKKNPDKIENPMTISTPESSIVVVPKPSLLTPSKDAYENRIFQSFFKPKIPSVGSAFTFRIPRRIVPITNALRDNQMIITESHPILQCYQEEIKQIPGRKLLEILMDTNKFSHFLFAFMRGLPASATKFIIEFIMTLAHPFCDSQEESDVLSLKRRSLDYMIEQMSQPLQVIVRMTFQLKYANNHLQGKFVKNRLQTLSELYSRLSESEVLLENIKFENPVLREVQEVFEPICILNLNCISRQPVFHETAVHLNETACMHLGFSNEEVEDLEREVHIQEQILNSPTQKVIPGMFRYYHWEDWPKVMSLLYLYDGTQTFRRIRLVTKSGDPIWCILTLVIIQESEDSKFVIIMGYPEDQLTELDLKFDGCDIFQECELEN